jgi:hypothetical protein
MWFARPVVPAELFGRCSEDRTALSILAASAWSISSSDAVSDIDDGRGGGILPEDDNEPDHVGERGEGGHRRRPQDDALANAQSGAWSGWKGRRAGQDEDGGGAHDGGVSFSAGIARG